MRLDQRFSVSHVWFESVWFERCGWSGEWGLDGLGVCWLGFGIVEVVWLESQVKETFGLRLGSV